MTKTIIKRAFPEPLQRHASLVDTDKGQPSFEFIANWEKLRLITQSIYETADTADAAIVKILDEIAAILAKRIDGTPEQINGGGLIGDTGDIKFSLPDHLAEITSIGGASTIGVMVINKNGVVTSATEIKVRLKPDNLNTVGVIGKNESKVLFANSNNQFVYGLVNLDEHTIGELPRSKIALRAVNQYLLDASPVLSGKSYLVGTSGGNLEWEKIPTAEVNGMGDQGAIIGFNRSFVNSTTSPTVLAFDKLDYGYEDFYSLRDGWITFTNPVHKSWLIFLSIGIKAREPMQRQTLVKIIIERKKDLGGGNEIIETLKEFELLEFNKYGYNSPRDYIAAFIDEAPNRKISIRFKIVDASGKAMVFNPLGKFPTTMLYIQPFKNRLKQTTGGRIFEETTKTSTATYETHYGVSVADLSFHAPSSNLTLIGKDDNQYLGTMRVSCDKDTPAVIDTAEQEYTIAKVEALQLGYILNAEDYKVDRWNDKTLKINLTFSADNPIAVRVCYWQQEPDDFLWSVMDSVSTYYAGWAELLREIKTNKGSVKDFTFNVPLPAKGRNFYALAVFITGAKITNLRIKDFSVSVSPEIHTREVIIRENSPIEYVMTTPSVKDGESPAGNAEVFGILPFSAGLLNDKVAKTSSIKFISKHEVNIDAMANRDIKASLVNPRNSKRTDILNIAETNSTRSQFFQFPAHTHIDGMKAGYLFHCRTNFDRSFTQNIEQPIKYLYYFSKPDEQFNRDVSDGVWKTTGYDRVIDIVSIIRDNNTAKRLYIVFPQTDDNYVFKRYPFGLNEVWHRSDGDVEGVSLSAYSMAHKLYELDYQLEISTVS